MFLVSSRYLNIPTASYLAPSGTQYVYLTRRFVPSPEVFAVLQVHAVVAGDRLDNLAAQYLGDPELFWRICDANCAMRPQDLARTVGRSLRMTLPEGIPGTPNA